MEPNGQGRGQIGMKRDPGGQGIHRGGKAIEKDFLDREHLLLLLLLGFAEIEDGFDEHLAPDEKKEDESQPRDDFGDEDASLLPRHFAGDHLGGLHEPEADQGHKGLHEAEDKGDEDRFLLVDVLIDQAVGEGDGKGVRG